MRILIAAILASSLGTSPLAWAGNSAVLTGSVLPSTDGRTIAKAVWVGAIPAPVAADGSFRVEGLPGGPAELAIETSDGMYVVASPVSLAPGTTRRVQLAFGGRQDTSAPPPPETPKKKKTGGAWASPIPATIIVVGSAIVVGLTVDQLTKSDTVPASPSATGN